MKTIILLYKNGDIVQQVCSEDLFKQLKEEYKSNKYNKDEQCYIFFSQEEFLDELNKAEANKLF